MTRFSVGGDEDGNEERSINNRTLDGNGERLTNNRPFPKRPRLFTLYSHRRTNAAASISNSGDRTTTSAATEVLRREEPDAVQEESEDQSSEESETSWSRSSSGSEEGLGEEQQQVQQNQVSGNEVQPTEARGDSTPNGNSTCQESRSGVSVTLSDPDVLDCPICFEPLCLPVYQCENGHIACASCCTKLKNKCGSCCWPIGYNRCRAIEKVLDSVRIICQNTPYGCTETLTYSKKQSHEKTCSYAPCSCPFTGCDYAATSKCLYSHFALKHSHLSKQFLFDSVIPISLKNTQDNIFLQDSGHSTLFILNRSEETVGSFVNIVCVGPISGQRPFLYELTAIAEASSIKLKTFVDFVPKWTAQSPKKMCLVIPSDFISINEELKLELIIRRNPAVPR